MLRYPLARGFRPGNTQFAFENAQIIHSFLNLQYTCMRICVKVYALMQDYCVKALQDGEIIGVAPGGSTEAIMAEVSGSRWQY
jgi:hypothetical protein